MGYTTLQKPLKTAFQILLILYYSFLPFIGALLPGLRHKKRFFLPKIVFLLQKSTIIIIAAKKRQRMESFVRMTLGRRQVNFVQAVIPLHTSSPSSSSSLSSLSISYHHH